MSLLAILAVAVVLIAVLPWALIVWVIWKNTRRWEGFGKGRDGV